jgi:hypothetical protein
VALLAGCATTKDVQLATDLIRTDNELTRLLVEVRPDDNDSAAVYLSGLATHAKDEADALELVPGKERDAIAYYRISATAYWRSGMTEDVNPLFEAVDKGSQLCVKLKDMAPDRDCLFLRLVIPFAGLEAKAQEKDLSELLEQVNFNDNIRTKKEIKTMQEIRNSLNQIRPLLLKIFKEGTDERLKSHSGMRTYYCNNAKKASDYYSPIADVFETKVIEFHRNFPNNTPPLEIDEDSAALLRVKNSGVPSFCQGGN